MSLRIRPARKADAAHLAVIELQTAPEFARFIFDGLNPDISLGAALTWRYGQNDPDGWRHSLVAEIDGDIAGALNGFLIKDIAKAPARDDPAYARLEALWDFQRGLIPGAWHITRLGVAPVFRRRGAARALLGAAMTRARSEGARLITLYAWEDNAPAQALYAREGFTRRGAIDVPPLPRLERQGRSLLLGRAL